MITEATWGGLFCLERNPSWRIKESLKKLEYWVEGQRRGWPGIQPGWGMLRAVGGAGVMYRDQREWWVFLMGLRLPQDKTLR